MNVENRTNKMWVPQRGEAIDNRDDVEDYYGYDPQRYIVYITSDSSSNKDLMTV